MELRHLRYFTTIVECKGYREASRYLHIAQPALTQTVLDLEAEIGSKLLVRETYGIAVTPAGEAFYGEAKRTLQQADGAIVAARRAAKGITGSLNIGFIPGATQHFLPELLQSFKREHPSIELDLRELTPSVQMELLLRGELDLGFTREVTAEQRSFLSSRLLFRVPLMAVLPASREVHSGEVDVASLANDRFVLLDRKESPPLFDSISNLCREAGFTPQISSHAHLAESMFTLVKAEEGISIVPMWARVFLTDGLKSARLTPETVQVELVAAWKTASPSVLLQSFLALLDAETARIVAATDRDVLQMNAD